jgi:hypothetical protein
MLYEGTRRVGQIWGYFEALLIWSKELIGSCVLFASALSSL